MGGEIAEITVSEANMKLQCPQCDEWVRLSVKDIQYGRQGECLVHLTCPFCKTEVTVSYG